MQTNHLHLQVLTLKASLLPSLTRIKQRNQFSFLIRVQMPLGLEYNGVNTL